MRGNARSLAPIIMGNQEISQHGGNGWNQEEEHHDLAVHGEHLVVGVGRHQIASRGEQFQPDQQGKKSADEKEERDRDADISSAMRLWSVVSSHDRMPYSALR